MYVPFLYSELFSNFIWSVYGREWSYLFYFGCRGDYRCIISCLSQHGQRQHRWSLSCVMGESILWSRSRLLFIYYGLLASLKDMCYAEYFVHGKYLSCASATVYLGCEATYADSLLLEYAWLCIS